MRSNSLASRIPVNVSQTTVQRPANGELAGSTHTDGRLAGGKLSKPNRVFKSIATIAEMPISQMIKTLEQEAQWTLDLAGTVISQCSRERIHDIGSFLTAISERLIVRALPKEGPPKFASLEDKVQRKTQYADIRDGELRSTKTTDKEELNYHKAKDGKVTMHISGLEDLFYGLKNTYMTGKSVSTERGYSPRMADSPYLFAASAVNLMRFVHNEGLDKFRSVELQIRPTKEHSYATLTCKNQGGKIEYTLEGIKDLPDLRWPKYAFKITMDKPGQLSICLEGASGRPSLLVREDGSCESSPWLEKGEVNNTDKLYLKQFITAHNPASFAALRDEYKRRIDKLATDDTAVLRTWNHIEAFEKLSVPQMAQSLLQEAESVKQYLSEHKPNQTGDGSYWHLEKPGLIYGKDSQDIAYESVDIRENTAGQITNFKISSSLRIEVEAARTDRSLRPYIYHSGYEMDYNYDESLGITTIKKTEPDGKKLKLTSEQGKVKLEYGGLSSSGIWSDSHSYPCHTIVDNLLEHIFQDQDRKIQANDDDLKLQAQSLIDIITKLKLQEAPNIEADFQGYKLAYKHDEASSNQLYSLEKDDTKIEVEQKFDNTTEVRLIEKGQTSYKRTMDALGKVNI